LFDSAKHPPAAALTRRMTFDLAMRLGTSGNALN
jgi:hypothetical protein